ncbi:hypothetical protein ONZ45_g11476 [Pleurotus djamor]|nr:hypothetical protein ONZ45_g11476 [Pleurotus djamor]
MPPQKRVASSAPGEVTDDEEQIQRKGRSGEVSEEEVTAPAKKKTRKQTAEPLPMVKTRSSARPGAVAAVRAVVAGLSSKGEGKVKAATEKPKAAGGKGKTTTKASASSKKTQEKDEAFIATQKLLERERAELESQARQSSALSAHADEELAKHIHSLAPPCFFQSHRPFPDLNAEVPDMDTETMKVEEAAEEAIAGSHLDLGVLPDMVDDDQVAEKDHGDGEEGEDSEDHEVEYSHDFRTHVASTV